MKNIYETLQDSETFSTFLDLAKRAELEPALRDGGPFTVFVPTDEAFSRVPSDRMDDIRQDKDKLILILSYHMVPQLLTAEDLRHISAVRSALGTDLVIRSSDKGITVNSVPIIEADAVCTNGICHAIDAALVPPVLNVLTL
jgi:uncharacterized surface protein with fasciclin (FAS1) repeats